MAMSALFFCFVQESPEHRHSFVYCTSALYMCEWQGKCAKSYRAEGHFHVCTQGQSVAECTKRGRAAVIVVLSPVPLTQPSQLFSLSATLAHMPVSCNCGLIPSLSIIFFLFFFLNHPLLSLSCRSVASNDLSPCFLLLALPCSTSPIFHPIIFSPLSLSPSFLLSFLLQTQCSSA